MLILGGKTFQLTNIQAKKAKLEEKLIEVEINGDGEVTYEVDWRTTVKVGEEEKSKGDDSGVTVSINVFSADDSRHISTSSNLSGVLC